MRNPTPKDLKRARFIAGWTGRRLSDVISAIEDEECAEVSAWFAEAENNYANNPAVKEYASREERINEARPLVEEVNAVVAHKQELKDRIDRRGKEVRGKGGPLNPWKGDTVRRWLIERGWKIPAWRAYERKYQKDDLSADSMADAVRAEIIAEIEREDGCSYKELLAFDAAEILKRAGLVGILTKTGWQWGTPYRESCEFAEGNHAERDQMEREREREEEERERSILEEPAHGPEAQIAFNLYLRKNRDILGYCRIDPWGRTVPHELWQQMLHWKDEVLTHLASG